MQYEKLGLYILLGLLAFRTHWAHSIPLCNHVRKEETIMTKDNLKYSTYIKTLEEELVPAMGCTDVVRRFITE